MRTFALFAFLLLGCPGSTDDSGKITDTSGDDGYHPDGWDDPTQHGMAAKFQEDGCLGCHGDDLGGGSAGVSCDDCHAAGWQTDCTFCHGTVGGTGAPPEDIDDQSTNLAFAPHAAHVSDTDLHVAWDCVACHQKPTEALSPGHFLVSDDTPGAAENDFSGGLAPSTTRTGTGCANNYCHGDGTGDNGSIEADDSISGCGDCHSERGLGGRHDDHLEEGVSCEDCHAGTAASDRKIADTALHVNGTVDVELDGDVTWNNGRCSGSCHGERHNNEGW